MLATIITISINILAFAVGLYIGSIIFGKDEPKVDTTKMQNPVKLYHPIVRTFEFRNGLTKAKLVADVLKPCMVEFYHHWYGNTVSFKWPDNLEQLADRILEWYNPGSGYTELLLVAHSDGNGSFQVDFTWKTPKPKFICSREAVEGFDISKSNTDFTASIFDPDEFKQRVADEMGLDSTTPLNMTCLGDTIYRVDLSVGKYHANTVAPALSCEQARHVANGFKACMRQWIALGQQSKVLSNTTRTSSNGHNLV